MLVLRIGNHQHDAADRWFPRNRVAQHDRARSPRRRPSCWQMGKQSIAEAQVAGYTTAFKWAAVIAIGFVVTVTMIQCKAPATTHSRKSPRTSDNDRQQQRPPDAVLAGAACSSSA